MKLQPKSSFKFYATILDSFSDYLNSDRIWEQYWGFSENPPHTQDEFHEKQFNSLIDKINRVPFESEAADKGTAFNEVIDCLIENRKSDKMILTSDVNQGIIQADYNKRLFIFPITLCKEFANYFKGALTQVMTEAILPTCFGDVLLYGYIDELMPTSVHDIKSTGQYSAFKFKNHWQHLVYPYCLMRNGNNVRLFEYNITDFKSTYTESYTFVPERDIPILTAHCEDFIRFLIDNKDRITDKKIFGLDDIQS